MSEVDRSKILGELGGVRQANILSALVSNLDDVAQAQELVGDSAGSAQAKFDIYQQSTEAKLNKLKQSFETLYDRILNSEMINNAVEGFTRLIDSLSQLDMKTVVAGVSFISTIKMMSSAMSTFKIVNTFTSATECVGLFQKMMFAMIKPTVASGVAMTGTAVATGGLSAGFGVLTTSIGLATKASLAFMMTPLGLALSALALVLGGLTYAFMKHSKEQKIFDEKVKSNKENVDSLTESLRTMNAEGIKESSKPLQEKQDQYQAEIEKRKKAIEELNKLKEKGVNTSNAPSYVTGNNKSGGTNYVSGSKEMDKDTKKLQELQSEIDNSSKAISSMSKEFETSGIVIDETTGKIEQLTEAKNALNMSDTLSSFETETQAIVQNQVEIRGLYNEYQNLSSIENKSASDKERLKAVTTALQGHIKGLTITYDENGNAMLGNINVIENVISALDAEGNTVVNVASAQRQAMESMVQVEINGTKSTIAQIRARIEARQLEMNLRKESGNQQGSIYWSPTSQSAKDALALAEWQKQYAESMANLNNLGGGSNYVGGGGAGYVPVNPDKGSSSSKEKEIADLEKLSDRYFDLNNALKQVENSLSALHTEMENADDETKIKLLQQEVKLLDDKKKAMQDILTEKKKQLAEEKQELSNAGFIIDSKGGVLNSQAKLDQLTAQANSLSGEAKEDAIKNVKRLEALLKNYNNMLLTDIPKITDDINDMKNEVISAQKEISSILAKQRDEYVKGLEKETNKLKDELNKRKDLMNKQYDEEDKADSLKDKENNLNELQQNLSDALRLGDKELIKNIRQQIAEAQKIIDQEIRANEKEAGNDRFDKESDKLDEDLKNKTDEIMKKFSDEEILKMVQNGVTDLTGLMDKITNSSSQITPIFAGISEIISSGWVKSLDVFLSKINNIKDIGFNMNVNANQPALAGVGGVNIKTGDLIIQGNVDKETLPDLQKMLDENNNYLFKEIDKAINGR